MAEMVHDLGALRALREVGRQGSIAAAAAVLGVSQQALSARMRTLERAMGVTLLGRTPSGSHLTEPGRLVVGWAEDVLDAADRLEAGLRSVRSGVSHRLAIAASQTIAEHLVPHWLVELRSVERAAAGQRSAGQRSAGQTDGYPPTVVELTVANSTGVLDLVRRREGGARFYRDSAPAVGLGHRAPARRRAAGGRRTGPSVGAPPPAAVIRRRSPRCRWSCGRPAAAPGTR